MKRKFQIGQRKIGLSEKPFIIAEMSANHNQSFDNAVNIVNSAADIGADAVKIQTFNPDTITLNSEKPGFTIKNNNSPWNGRRLYELYEQAYMDWNWIPELSEICKQRGIIFFSSVFDNTSVDFLEDVGVPAYKIASFENNHYPLIKRVAETGKPMIISTGASDKSDIDELVAFLNGLEVDNFALLKCTSDYPARVEESNLASISVMREEYQCEVGLSDHTIGVGAALAGVALGATIIEKHFIHSGDQVTVDSTFSSDESQMRLLISEAERAWQAVGKNQFDMSENEKNNIQFKRSIYAAADINVGEEFSEANIKVVRPGYGMHPKYFEDLLGKSSSQNYEFGDPIHELVLK